MTFEKNFKMNGDVSIKCSKNNENDSHNYYNKRVISQPSLSRS